MKVTRRDFIKSAAKAGIVLTVPRLPLSEEVQFGVIADIHQDLIPDGQRRLDSFLRDVETRRLDFIVQLGDFCFPIPANREFVDSFNTYSGDSYHVLGNHDMDLGFSREETMAFWGMKSKYYSFVKSGLRFIVLDGNDQNPPPFEGYPRYIGPIQIEWLEMQLKQSAEPIVVLSHQSLENQDGGVDNCPAVRKVLETHNQMRPDAPVIACLSGHHHTDYVEKINGIYYIQINSASYNWVGANYKAKRYSEEIHSKYKWLEHMIPYKDPLYTFVSVNPGGFLRIEGKRSTFVEPGPKALGMPEQPENSPIVPYISKSKLRLS